jgi:hypothetical protein
MEAKTAGGIYLPESSVKELNEAKVLAVGPGGLDKDGKRVACSVAPGDKVLIPQVSLVCLCLPSGLGLEKEDVDGHWDLAGVWSRGLLADERAVWWITSQGWR